MVTGTIIRRTYKINNKMKTCPQFILILSNFEKKMSPNFLTLKTDFFKKFYYIMYRIASLIFTDHFKKNKSNLATKCLHKKNVI